MTRSQTDELSKDLVRIMLDAEDDILREIAAQLTRDGDISDTSKWRMRQLARAGRLDKRTAALIADYSKLASEEALDIILRAAETEIGYVDTALRDVNRKGLGEYFSEVPAESSALHAAKAFQKQAKSDLNLVNTVMRYKARQVYTGAVNAVYKELQAQERQNVLDVMGKGAAKAVTGQMSLQEATRKTIRELASKGIPAFVDKTGREWSPEAYVMMDMRSTLANTARAAQDMRCDQYGINLIEVSSHMGARPKCAPYQGRIFSRDGSSGVTTDGSGNKVAYKPLSSTSYGQPDGLFGINCGHVQYPYISGISLQRYFPYDEEENAERYKQFQRQRAMERQIRATKRECMMLQETEDKEGLQKASQRLRSQKQKYSQFSRDCGLGTHYDRTQVYGYDRSKSAKTVWAERKAAGNVLTNSPNSSIIKTREQTKAIIAKAQAQSKPIFAVDDAVRGPFATNVSQVPPKNGYYDVALHGNPKNVEFFDEPIDAKTLAKIIKSRKDYPKGSKVRLLSCSTGKITDTANCFAQQLANALGVEVEAPTKDIFVYPNGNFDIGKRNDGEMKTFYPRE